MPSGYSATTRALSGPVTIIPRIGKATDRTRAPSPRSSSNASDPGLTVSPHNLSRGNRARSTSRTVRPARARVSAAMLPAGPAPTTRTSVGTAENQRRVLGSKAEAVAQRSVDVRLASVLRNEVHVACRIRIVEVDGWRQHPVPHRKNRRGHTGRAAGTLRMPDHRFDRRPRDAISVRTEHASHAARFNRVVQLGRGAVVADVPDLLWRAPRFLQRHFDAAHDLATIGIHLDAVIRVAG